MQSNSFFVFKILLNMYIILQIPVLNFSQISVNLYQMAHPMISLSTVSSFIEVTIKISLSQAAFLEPWHRDDNFHQWNLEEVGNFSGLTQVEQRMSRSISGVVSDINFGEILSDYCFKLFSVPIFLLLIFPLCIYYTSSSCPTILRYSVLIF